MIGGRREAWTRRRGGRRGTSGVDAWSTCGPRRRRERCACRCACVPGWDGLTPDSRFRRTCGAIAEGLLPNVEVPAALRAASAAGVESPWHGLDPGPCGASAVRRSRGGLGTPPRTCCALRASWREELAAQCDLARLRLRNPFRPPPSRPWHAPRRPGDGAGDHRRGPLRRLAILADALEDAGCGTRTCSATAAGRLARPRCW